MLYVAVVLMSLLTGMMVYAETPPPPERTAEPEASHILPPAEITLEDPVVTPGCVEPNPEAELRRLDYYGPETVTDYLNAGGEIDRLREMLAMYTVSEKPLISQLTVVDMTGDGEPEIFLAMTYGYYGDTGAGESFLAMSRCEDGLYTHTTQFIRAGAGIRSEGLYTGGGMRILYVGDLNANGKVDMLQAVGWEIDLYGDGETFLASEYYLVEYDPGTDEFISLFPPVPEDAYRVYTTVTGEAVSAEVIDLDEDGIQEVIIDGTIYRWDSEVLTYVPNDEGEDQDAE